MIDARLLGILAKFTDRDETGKHFTERYDDADIEALVAAGMVTIQRPVHPQTGGEYSQEYWNAQVTEQGVDYVNDHYEGVKEIGNHTTSADRWEAVAKDLGKRASHDHGEEFNEYADRGATDEYDAKVWAETWAKLEAEGATDEDGCREAWRSGLYG